MDIYYPDSTRWEMPAAGWSVVIVYSLGGYIGSSKPSEVTPINNIPHDLLERGIVVALAVLPVARGGASGNAESGGTYGDAYKGNGVFVPPSGNPGPGSVPLGYLDTHPWADEDWLMPEKSARDALQHLRANAAVLNINPNKVGCWGSSAGAGAAAFSVFGPDRADPANSVPQRRESTRFTTAALQQCPVSWITFKQDSAIPAVHWPVKNPDSSSPYDPWDWDEPSEFLQETQSQYLLTGSPYYYGTLDATWPGLTALNQAQSVWMQYSDPINATLKATSNRYTSVPTNVEDGIHSAYGGYLIKAKLTTGIVLVLGDADVVDSSAEDNGGMAADYIIEDVTDRTIALVNHLVNNLGGEPVAVNQTTTHYADLEDDVLPLIKRLGQDIDSYTPLITTEEATQILSSVEALIDTALDAYGLDVPVTTPTHFVYALRMIAAWGAAYHIVESYMLNDPSPGLQAVADFWRVQFEKGIESLRDGTAIPRSLASPVGRPASHLYDYPDADPDLGVNANPAFTRGRDW